MSMAVDNRQQSLLNGMPYESHYRSPQFTNPWGGATSGAAPSQMYASSLAPSSAPLASTAPQQPMRPAALNLQYPGAVSAAPLASGSVIPAAGLGQLDLLGASQDRLNATAYGTQYSASPSTATFAPATTSAYPMDYGNRTAAAYGFADTRRTSHPLNNEEQRNSFSDALEASRNMVSMSQSDITPRNIYGPPGDRSSVSSYGFPSAHSAHSSISGSSYAPSYYNASVEGSVTDYSSASESVDMNSRTLPRPSSLIGGAMPPAPQSMMGQFSSKVASSSQKKHKCKICDKRFTRPSSLQTHMYSHTGEKPFACEVEGCGRHFSVVSNLRRHRKVHKGDGDHSDDHPSPED